MIARLPRPARCHVRMFAMVVGAFVALVFLIGLLLGYLIAATSWKSTSKPTVEPIVEPSVQPTSCSEPTSRSATLRKLARSPDSSCKDCARGQADTEETYDENPEETYGQLTVWHVPRSDVFHNDRKCSYVKESSNVQALILGHRCKSKQCKTAAFKAL